MSLQIQYVSDLHLEFSQNSAYLAANPIVPTAPILVMCGDICLFKYIDKHMEYFKLLASQYETIYWLPGNHEYYEYDLAHKEGSFCETILPNFFLVNNHSVIKNNHKLIFSCLWTYISPQFQQAIEQGLNDFRLIKHNGLPLTTADYNAQHFEALAYIRKEVRFANKAEQTATVFTHAVPTLLNYPPQYLDDPVNNAFVVDLIDFIESENITHWVYGHSHFNTPDFTIKNTQLLTNQLCYVLHNEHSSFNFEKKLEIK